MDLNHDYSASVSVRPPQSSGVQFFCRDRIRAQAADEKALTNIRRKHGGFMTTLNSCRLQLPRRKELLCHDSMGKTMSKPRGGFEAALRA